MATASEAIMIELEKEVTVQFSFQLEI